MEKKVNHKHHQHYSKLGVLSFALAWSLTLSIFYLIFLAIIRSKFLNFIALNFYRNIYELIRIKIHFTFSDLIISSIHLFIITFVLTAFFALLYNLFIGDCQCKSD